MTEDNIYVFTPYSLDGAGSLLSIKWFMELLNHKNVNLVSVNTVSVKQDYKSFKESFEYQSAKKIYIVGGYLAKEILEFIKGDEKVTVFALKEENTNDIQDVKVVDGDFPSYTALICNKFKDKKDLKLNDKQNLLISLIEDYISYELKYDKISLGLNTIFYNFQGNKVENFCKKYEKGFDTFSEDDKKIISFYRLKLEKILEAKKYEGDFSVGGKERKLIAIFSDTCINEVAAALLKKYNADIAVIVNPQTQRVSFRRGKNVDVDLKSLCRKLCEGDGKKYAATGKITEKFLTLTKLLKEVE
jgi:hypothetical protein